MPRDIDMRKEYNLLTKHLLEEGYTKDRHPDYVKVCQSAWGKELWQNSAGGFEYTGEHLSKMVFKTGCGLLVKGNRFTVGRMSYMGIDWIPENNNPVITCPYRKDGCDLRNPVLGGMEGSVVKILQCDCRQTNEPYSYERSIDKIRDDENREIRRKYDAFSERVKGHVCYWQMRYNYCTGEWQQRYDPLECSRMCQNIGGVCSLTHRPVSRKRGNVFYDVRTSYIRRDGTLFDGEKVVRIEKGLRLFDTGKSMTICEQAERRCKEHIYSLVKNRYHAEILLYGLKVEVLNIRAEQRESRDLMQDLQDIKDGIEVIHASDMQNIQKEEKKKRRQQMKEKRIKKLEKKLLEVGYYNLEEYSLDRIHADKWLGTERIEELEQMREQKMNEEKNLPVQISLFDFPEVMP